MTDQSPVVSKPKRGRGRPPKTETPAPAHGGLKVPDGVANNVGPDTAGPYVATSAHLDTAKTAQAQTASRPPLRPDMRAEDPRAAAAIRAAEILEHLDGMDEGTDEFYISPDMVPNGWDYNWKRRLIMGKPDPAYDVSLRRTGWTDVPANRHPEMMPLNMASGASIERKGMVLMERPQQITDRQMARDNKLARDQVRVKEQQLRETPNGQFSRTEDPRTAPKVSRSYEPMPVPTDK